jgi:hypothetical protein
MMVSTTTTEVIPAINVVPCTTIWLVWSPSRAVQA